MTPNELKEALEDNITIKVKNIIINKSVEEDDPLARLLAETSAKAIAAGGEVDLSAAIEHDEGLKDNILIPTQDARDSITSAKTQRLVHEVTAKTLQSMGFSIGYTDQAEIEINKYLDNDPKAKMSQYSIEDFEKADAELKRMTAELTPEELNKVESISKGKAIGPKKSGLKGTFQYRVDTPFTKGVGDLMVVINDMKAGKFEYSMYQTMYEYVAQNFFPSTEQSFDTTQQEELKEKLAITIRSNPEFVILESPSEYGYSAQTPYVVNEIVKDLNNSIVTESTGLSSFYVDKNNTVYMTERDRKKEFLLQAGTSLNGERFSLHDKYSDGGQFKKDFDRMWPTIEQEIFAEEGTKKISNQSWSAGAPKLIDAYRNGNAEWLGTIVGPTRFKPTPVQTFGAVGPIQFRRATTGVSDTEYAEYRIKQQDPTQALKNVKSILGPQAANITNERLQILANTLAESMGLLTQEDYGAYKTDSELVTNYNLSRGILQPLITKERIQQYANEKQTEDIIKDDDLLTQTANTLLGYGEITDPETGEPLIFNANEQLKVAIQNLLSNNPFEGLTAEDAGQKVLQTMGITPEGNLAEKPKVKLSDEAIKFAQENPNQYVETYGEILGGAPADFNAEERAATKYATNYIKDYDVDEMLRAQYDDRRPPMVPSVFGPPGFRVEEVPPPVTDQEILKSLQASYSDQPEFLKFLLPNLDYLKEEFLKTQTPSIEQQEGSVDLFAKQQIMGQFEKERPKNIGEFLSEGLPGNLQNQFKFSDLGKQYEQRIKQEQEAIDERNKLEERNQEAIRRRELSSPVTIFGRRRR